MKNNVASSEINQSDDQKVFCMKLLLQLGHRAQENIFGII